MAARLTIIHVTNVSLLDNLPHLRTLIKEYKAVNPETIAILTGDFLAPSLLSSIDKGAGMMKILTQVPINYLTWGNHEADLPHWEVCKRVAEFHRAGGLWINSNMQSHEMMHLQEPYAVATVVSRDGKYSRKVGFIGVLTNDPGVYKKFTRPGPFNGATIEDPWQTLAKYKKILEEEEKCDLVIPLQHLYEPEDRRTLEMFDFPVVLSGHDHHLVDKCVEGSRLLKPGSEAHYATVLDIKWDSSKATKPEFSWEHVKVSGSEPDAELLEEVKRTLAPLEAIQNTELAPVPRHFRPLSSVNSRGVVTTVGQFLCSTVRDAVNKDPHQHDCDLCMMLGGHIYGEKDFPNDSYFSLEDLKALNVDKVLIEVVEMPGSLIVDGVKSTRGRVGRTFIQYCDAVKEENDVITSIGRCLVDPEKMYRVATTPPTLREVSAFYAYFQRHSECRAEEFVPLDVELLSYCARCIWDRICQLTLIEGLDTDKNGAIGEKEIQACMKRLGLHTSERDFSLLDFMVRIADSDHSGQVFVNNEPVTVKTTSAKGRHSFFVR
eukprot:TRINITY_DN23545_c0_g1_i1.p1 TRINITY_DN23545_c0_g1~~TRINITY_DN23545_c0_g1_i1.p1  ORF type:complete len:547 (-),score=120.82 TRINITY_DN23545_c0_g1_i1:427-2067(-)